MAQPIARTRSASRPLGGSIALLLSIVLAAAALAVAAPVRAVGGDGLRQAANGYRTGEGLDPVGASSLLDDIAVHRANQMVAANEMEHDLGYVYDRLDGSGVCYRGVGEIIAWERGYPDYSYGRTMALWWNSPGHHDIMMGDHYNAAGGAWKRAADGAHYSVMIFAELCSGTVTTTSTPLLKPERRYNPDRPMVFRRGTFTGYRLSATGEVLSKRTVRYMDWQRLTSAGRTPGEGGRAWLKVSEGRLAGYWVRETDSSYVRGMTARTNFEPSRQLVVKPGKYTGLKFDWLGGPEQEKVFRTSSRAKMRTSARAMISGRMFFLVSSGPLEGYWLRDTDNVFLR